MSGANVSDASVGCLLGGAVGDALGAPVEFLSTDGIRRRYGDAGITGYVEFWSGQGAFTDDTQMTLFTAEGLALAGEKARGGGPKALFAIVESVHRAYLRWLLTQGEEANWGRARATPAALKAEGWLILEEGLWARRSPGMTCLAALQSGRCGSTSDPINVSQGCGGVMRVAPVGLRCADPEEAFRMGCEVAAITHGHPSGYLPAGFLAALVSSLSRGEALLPSVERATALLRAWKGHAETLAAVERAVARGAERSRLGNVTGLPFPEAIESLAQQDDTHGPGGGWTGHTALAIALFCALCHPDDFRAGALAAVNHGGDSDTTGAIAGNILGAKLGKAAIPREWVSGLDMADLVEGSLLV
ncbi:MAG TPA: ADP-ribosylglycohydrolase family protein [Acidobacteriota bacterium]|nr:ADP-ribosylglycohydrolase family protein [Acidobacteriota bacterium]